MLAHLGIVALVAMNSVFMNQQYVLNRVSSNRNTHKTMGSVRITRSKVQYLRYLQTWARLGRKQSASSRQRLLVLVRGPFRWRRCFKVGNGSSSQSLRLGRIRGPRGSWKGPFQRVVGRSFGDAFSRNFSEDKTTKVSE